MRILLWVQDLAVVGGNGSIFTPKGAQLLA